MPIYQSECLIPCSILPELLLFLLYSYLSTIGSAIALAFNSRVERDRNQPQTGSLEKPWVENAHGPRPRSFRSPSTKYCCWVSIAFFPMIDGRKLESFSFPLPFLPAKFISHSPPFLFPTLVKCSEWADRPRRPSSLGSL